MYIHVIFCICVVHSACFPKMIQHDPIPAPAPAELSELHEAIDTNAQRSDGRLGGQDTSVEGLPGWTFLGRSGGTDQHLPVILPKASLRAQGVTLLRSGGSDPPEDDIG